MVKSFDLLVVAKYPSLGQLGNDLFLHLLHFQFHVLPQALESVLVSFLKLVLELDCDQSLQQLQVLHFLRKVKPWRLIFCGTALAPVDQGSEVEDELERWGEGRFLSQELSLNGCMDRWMT